MSGDIASYLINPDFVCRFEAQLLLEEAFVLIRGVESALGSAMGQIHVMEYDHVLIE